MSMATNKYQEALDCVKATSKAFFDYVLPKQEQEAFDTLQELVDKETNKKPLKVTDYDLPPYKGDAIVCPHCHKPLGIAVIRCHTCGQKIDWSGVL